MGKKLGGSSVTSYVAIRIPIDKNLISPEYYSELITLSGKAANLKIENVNWVYINPDYVMAIIDNTDPITGFFIKIIELKISDLMQINNDVRKELLLPEGDDFRIITGIAGMEA